MMISHQKNRVQAIKSKFENLNNENAPLLKRETENQLCKQKVGNVNVSEHKPDEIKQKHVDRTAESDSSSDDWSSKPNESYLYKNNIIPQNIDNKTSLSRQTSDPGKKLHRSHAFRCDRSQMAPKRHGSCNGRSESGNFSLKPEKKLSKERLKILGNFLEDQMKKENFVPSSSVVVHSAQPDSIPDNEVPQNILVQYAKVVKPKKKEEKNDTMTDSGVSSETENPEDDKAGRIKKLLVQFEKADDVKTNLESMDDLCASSETMRLERKNPHLKLTETLKKALKQPLPPGPPPKKPPRTFVVSPIPESSEKPRKDAKKMLEKLEQVYERRKALNQCKSSIPTSDTPKQQKEVHYLCTEILDITQRTLLPNQSPLDPLSRCFNSLNCANSNSVSSLPYTRLSTHDEEVNECCRCSKESLNEEDKLSTFLSEKKCSKCQVNSAKNDSFKCHLKCECSPKKSEFFIDDEHIYDEPCIGDVSERRSKYGTLNTLKNHASKSLEDLREKKTEDLIYDIPCDISRPASPDDEKTDFEKLLQNFESGFRVDTEQDNKPKTKPKPMMKISKSTENIVENAFKKAPQKKYSTEVKRYRNRCEVGFSLPKKEAQLDYDRENLNRLMNEIYETVTAACDMDSENKPGSFPTDTSDGSNSEDSVKLTRSLTEKRKNYVRRVSSRVAYLDKKSLNRYRHQTSVCTYKPEPDNPYSTFRSWKSFRASQTNLPKVNMERHDSVDSKFNLTDSEGNLLSMKQEFGSLSDLSLDEKAGCVDLDLPFVRENGLFNVCLLVGMNYMTGEAYVKSVFPKQVQVPPHIENLIFPETLSEGKEWTADAKSTQCYSLVLTDERGERSYGYCRRVLPEGATSCLPLCYCVIGKFRAPGFYYKVLQEIESHHGSSEVQINSILQQLFDTDFPGPGEEISITYDGKVNKSQTMPDTRRSGGNVSDYDIPEYYDLENNNGPKTVFLNLEMPRMKTIKRPIDPRADEDCMSRMLDLLGSGLVIKVFGTLLLERKVIIIGDKLSEVSSCIEALQAALYPLQWQQPLIASVPRELQRHVLDAPIPMLAGSLQPHLHTHSFEEGMVIDLTAPSKVRFYQGDESTILPASSYKLLKTSLQMESNKNKDKEEDRKTRNVMISEAFLRFFVDILNGYWRHLHPGTGLSTRDRVVFDKEEFVKKAPSKQKQLFLEWFTETAMFNHFIDNMAARHHDSDVRLVDAPLPHHYRLFDERLPSQTTRPVHKYDSKYRATLTSKVRLLKSRLRDLVA